VKRYVIIADGDGEYCGTFVATDPDEFLARWESAHGYGDWHHWIEEIIVDDKDIDKAMEYKKLPLCKYDFCGRRGCTIDHYNVKPLPDKIFNFKRKEDQLE
jgi:hypothetical protein